MNNTIHPVIKWAGSKRTQAEEIIALFPDNIMTYYEPFCGGCSVLIRLLESKKVARRYVVSDVNRDLISLWNLIKADPYTVYTEYNFLWKELNKNDNMERKKKFYFYIRDRFNKDRSPTDFMFIMRTTVNGMPRYNKSGEFNNAFHVTRKGIEPEKLRNILSYWNHKLNFNNVEFVCQEYKDIQSSKGDVLYLDPPYAGTRGMYYGAINYNDLWEWMRKQKGKYYLSFDGKTTSFDNTFAVPKDLYMDHKYLYAGNSSFRRIIGKSNSEYVKESMYIGN